MPASKPHPKPDTFHVVGQPQRKVDGLAKSTGQALYTDDITLPRMLHCKLLRSPHAHARILSIDAAEALAMPGVVAVITGQDMPVKYGVIPWTHDEYPLCVDKARFVGDAVAAVAATSERAAFDALQKVRVLYEPLPPVLSLDDARRGDVQVNDYARRGNVLKNVKLTFGDLDQGFAAADLIAEDDFYFENTTHAPIEPHCALAAVDPTGRLTVWSATQVPHYLHRELARVLALDEARVRVIQPALGGAFGGKSEPFDLEFCVAKLALLTGRPVKCLYTREEVFYSHRGRHPMQMRFKTGVKADGTITAVQSKCDLDGGAYASFGLVTSYYAGQLMTAPYQMPAYGYDSTRYYTNKPACGPKRGHGTVQPRFAFEVQLDDIAHRLNIDPIDLRRRNFIGDYTQTVNGQRITSNGFLMCLDAVERASGWRDRYGKLPFGRGLGVAGSMYISGTNYPVYPNDMPQSGVQLQADRSGRVTVFSGASDIGQGSDSMLAMILAEELGVSFDDVRVVSSDTDLCPVDLGAYSSRVTFMAGNACIDAARKLKAPIAQAVAAQWGVPPSQVGFAARRAFDLRDTARHVSWVQALHWAEALHGTLGATGWYNTPTLGGDYRGGTIGASPAYSFTAHVVEVEVDPTTGQWFAHKVWVAHDCGKALNPVIVEGQMEGSAYMGLAEAQMEAQTYNDLGLHTCPSLLDYRIPTALDTPEIQSLIVESHDPEGPYGAKEAGEGPLHPVIPATSNAIFDAVGVRLRSLPFTPLDILQGLNRPNPNPTSNPT
jgi:4-hydroxybenzoyl-CoA reductase alpha subunit